MKSAATRIRRYRAGDFMAVTILWRIAREKALPDLQRRKGHFFHEDLAYFQNHVLLNDNVWVAILDKTCVAFMAMTGNFIDQLYVHPDHWRRGIGTALLNVTKKRSPNHVWLYTLQANINARIFYEKRGFGSEIFGISPAPESEPDVQYHWRCESAPVAGRRRQRSDP